MPENNDLNQVSEIDFLKKLLSTAQRHISNIENTVAMMRNGHFIDAYNRIHSTKEGLEFIRKTVEDRIISRPSKE